MVLNDAKFYRMVKIGTDWYQVVPNGAELCQKVWNDAELYWMGWIGTEWYRMAINLQSGTEW